MKAGVFVAVGVNVLAKVGVFVGRLKVSVKSGGESMLAEVKLDAGSTVGVGTTSIGRTLGIITITTAKIVAIARRMAKII